MDILQGHRNPMSKLMIYRESDGCRVRYLIGVGHAEASSAREAIKLAHSRRRRLPVDLLAYEALII